MQTFVKTLHFSHVLCNLFVPFIFKWLCRIKIIFNHNLCLTVRFRGNDDELYHEWNDNNFVEVSHTSNNTIRRLSQQTCSKNLNIPGKYSLNFPIQQLQLLIAFQTEQSQMISFRYPWRRNRILFKLLFRSQGNSTL